MMGIYVQDQLRQDTKLPWNQNRVKKKFPTPRRIKRLSECRHCPLVAILFHYMKQNMFHCSSNVVSSCSLRPLDVEFMSRLSKVVNIVPVIAKADTLTLEERDSFKQTVRRDSRTCCTVLVSVAKISHEPLDEVH